MASATPHVWAGGFARRGRFVREGGVGTARDTRGGCAVQLRQCRSRWARQRSRCRSAEGNRAAPCTVPMKEVPQQCGALGRFRPAPSVYRGAHGPSRSSVRVCTVSRAGCAVPSLRPWPALLHAFVLAPGPGQRTTPDRAALPAQPRRTQSPRGALTALARAPAAHRTWAERCTCKQSDAPGFPRPCARCSTGSMEPRQRHIEAAPSHSGMRQRAGGDVDRDVGCRVGRDARSLPTLRCRTAALGASGLCAPIGANASLRAP